MCITHLQYRLEQDSFIHVLHTCSIDSASLVPAICNTATPLSECTSTCGTRKVHHTSVNNQSHRNDLKHVRPCVTQKSDKTHINLCLTRPVTTCTAQKSRQDIIHTQLVSHKNHVTHSNLCHTEIKTCNIVCHT